MPYYEHISIINKIVIFDIIVEVGDKDVNIFLLI